MSQVKFRIARDHDFDLACLAVEHESLGKPASDMPAATLIFAGDICWTPRPGAVDPSELTESPWAPFVPLLAAQDVSVVNLEAALTTRDLPITKSGPRVRSAPSLAAVIRAGGFSAVGLANNHVGDFGGRGVLDTIEACRSAGLSVVGAGVGSEEAAEPLVVKLGSLNVALVAVAEGHLGSATPARPGAACLRDGLAQTVVARVRPSVDAVVVMLHGGNEYYTLPSPHLAATARSFVAAGASAVVVHHQHVPLGVEICDGAPIFYGTGNFLFPMYYPFKEPEWHEGYLVRLDLTRGAVCAASLYPYGQSRGRRRVEPMAPAEVEAFAGKLERRCALVADPDALDREWTRFCSAQRARYLAALLGLTRLEKRLVRLLGIWPRWRMRPDRVAALLTVLTNDSHREVARALLEEEVRRSGVPSKGV